LTDSNISEMQFSLAVALSVDIQGITMEVQNKPETKVPWQVWVVVTILVAAIPVVPQTIEAISKIPSAKSTAVSSAQASPSTTKLEQPLQIEGIWQSAQEGIIEFNQRGTIISGSYSYAAEDGHRYGYLEGEIISGKISFKWWEGRTIDASYEQSVDKGDGYLLLSEDGNNLNGAWRHENEVSRSNPWSLIRR
jgi:hypothetical protein